MEPEQQEDPPTVQREQLEERLLEDRTQVFAATEGVYNSQVQLDGALGAAFRTEQELNTMAGAGTVIIEKGMGLVEHSPNRLGDLPGIVGGEEVISEIGSPPMQPPPEDANNQESNQPLLQAAESLFYKVARDSSKLNLLYQFLLGLSAEEPPRSLAAQLDNLQLNDASEQRIAQPDDLQLNPDTDDNGGGSNNDASEQRDGRGNNNNMEEGRRLETYSTENFLWHQPPPGTDVASHVRSFLQSYSHPTTMFSHLKNKQFQALIQTLNKKDDSEIDYWNSEHCHALFKPLKLSNKVRRKRLLILETTLARKEFYFKLIAVCVSTALLLFLPSNGQLPHSFCFTGRKLVG